MRKFYISILVASSMLLNSSLLVSCAGGHHPKDKDERKEPALKDQEKPTQDVQGEPTIRFKFFLERSGSMIAYDNVKTKGEFKAAIADLLNSVPTSDQDVNMLYIVNNGVYPYKATYKQFAMCKDIFKETKNLGDPRYTDFTCIFDSIMSRTGKNEISILVSDLIYSTSEMSTVRVEKILEEARYLTTTVFKGRNNMDVLLIKMIADYNGAYYVYNQPSVGQNYVGRRPYYFVIVANHNVMERIFKEDQYADFRNFHKLKGYENYYLFESIDAGNPHYSLLPADNHNKNTQFQITKGQDHDVHAIEKVKANHNGDVYLTVAVDLGLVFTSEEQKCDPETYTIKSKSNYEIDEIVPITKEMRKGTFDRYAKSATHLMVLHTTVSELKRVDNITIAMPNVLPEWIHESSSDNDTNLKSSKFASTTFALEYLCKGIYDAYYSSVDEPKYFELLINTK